MAIDELRRAEKGVRVMRKRDSKRRWKARAKLGQLIPREAIVNYDLHLLGSWRCVSDYLEFYRLGTV